MGNLIKHTDSHFGVDPHSTISQYYIGELQINTNISGERKVTIQELNSHNKDHDDPWTSIDGKVYTIKKWQDEHPGRKAVLNAAGIDGTDLFSNNPTPFNKFAI